MNSVKESLLKQPEAAQRSYYLDHPTLLSPFETPWDELSRRGYVGGGIVLLIINQQGELLLNQVPSHREKPQIGRFAGQWNVFTETIERYVDGPNKGQFECFIDNLDRAIVEEIGPFALQKMFVPDDAFRETDYRDPRARQKIRVHCVIVGTSPDVLSLIDDHDAKKKARELGSFSWMPIASLSAVKLEPNARRIIRRMERSGYLQRMSDRVVSGAQGTRLVDYIKQKRVA
ncbi:MAG: hypothetical protein Q8L37_03430 [Candidatus Gottesmanbacteria bacterium]|nr:hypothetical protein [Candidatus Gottesmanbacteria bacterium]